MVSNTIKIIGAVVLFVLVFGGTFVLFGKTVINPAATPGLGELVGDIVVETSNEIVDDVCPFEGERECLGEFVAGQEFRWCGDLDADDVLEWNLGHCGSDAKCTYSPGPVCVSLDAF